MFFEVEMLVSLRHFCGYDLIRSIWPRRVNPNVRRVYSCLIYAHGNARVRVYVADLPPSTINVTPLIMSALSLNKYSTGWTTSFTSAKKTNCIAVCK